MVEKVKSEMETNPFNLTNKISVIGSLATFKFACSSDRIRVGAALRVLLHFVEETITNALNSRFCTTDKSFLLIISECNVDSQSWKRLRSYPEVVNYLLKIFATYQTSAEFDAVILWYV